MASGGSGSNSSGSSGGGGSSSGNSIIAAATAAVGRGGQWQRQRHLLKLISYILQLIVKVLILTIF